MKNQQKEFIDFLNTQNTDKCKEKLHLLDVINSACKLFTIGTPEYNVCKLLNANCFKCEYCL